MWTLGVGVTYACLLGASFVSGTVNIEYEDQSGCFTEISTGSQDFVPWFFDDVAATADSTESFAFSQLGLGGNDLDSALTIFTVQQEDDAKAFGIVVGSETLAVTGSVTLTCNPDAGSLIEVVDNTANADLTGQFTLSFDSDGAPDFKGVLFSVATETESVTCTVDALTTLTKVLVVGDAGTVFDLGLPATGHEFSFNVGDECTACFVDTPAGCPFNQKCAQFSGNDGICEDLSNDDCAPGICTGINEVCRRLDVTSNAETCVVSCDSGSLTNCEEATSACFVEDGYCVDCENPCQNEGVCELVIASAVATCNCDNIAFEGAECETETVCPALTLSGTIANANIGNCSAAETSNGVECAIACNVGFVANIEGNLAYTCDATLESPAWVLSNDEVICNEIPCDDFDEFFTGLTPPASVTSGGCSGVNTGQGSSCSIACEVGYEVVSGASLVYDCLAASAPDWTAADDIGSVCQQIPCEDFDTFFTNLMPPASVTIGTCSGADTGHGDTCSIACADGYVAPNLAGLVYTCEAGDSPAWTLAVDIQDVCEVACATTDVAGCTFTETCEVINDAVDAEAGFCRALDDTSCGAGVNCAESSQICVEETLGVQECRVPCDTSATTSACNAETRCVDGINRDDASTDGFCRTCSLTCANGTCEFAAEDSAEQLCTCTEGFVGETCELACPVCANGECVLGVNVVDDSAAAVCDCVGTGFYGALCENDQGDCEPFVDYVNASSIANVAAANCSEVARDAACTLECADGFEVDDNNTLSYTCGGEGAPSVWIANEAGEAVCTAIVVPCSEAVIVADGFDAACCTNATQCVAGAGGCSSDDQCVEGLECGDSCSPAIFNASALINATAMCCAEPTVAPTTTTDPDEVSAALGRLDSAAVFVVAAAAIVAGRLAIDA